MDEMQTLVDGALRTLRDNARAFNDDSALDRARAFFHAIDWKEPFVRGLLCAHVVLLVLAILAGRSEEAQGVLFVAILGLVYGSERLNALGAAHWRRFATQNYFDRQGVFVGVMWSGPLLLLLCALLVRLVWRLALMLVRVKRAEVARAARVRARAAGDGDAAAAAGATAKAGGAGVGARKRRG